MNLLDSLKRIRKRYFSTKEKENHVTDLENIPVEKITPKKCFSGLSDSLWLSLLLNPKSMELPGFPSADIQSRFTGRADFSTLIQAFEFYDVIRKACSSSSKPIQSMDAILDFGCGWGRITRIFLRDIEPNKIYGCDCTKEAISICKETNKWCNFDLNNSYPPLGYKSSMFDLIYAYSVFSHLSEDSQKAWLKEFHRILKPGGILIATTRQRDFIKQLSRLDYFSQFIKADSSRPDNNHIERALKDYDEGKFVYFGTGGGFKLSGDFYGEAFVSKSYVEKNWSNLYNIVDFILKPPPNIDQNIIVAVKK
jgi:ubiquinone/menaquinone biosynthesis C-methylase UbiE